jgi:hypothetical protein
MYNRAKKTAPFVYFFFISIVSMCIVKTSSSIFEKKKTTIVISHLFAQTESFPLFLGTVFVQLETVPTSFLRSFFFSFWGAFRHLASWQQIPRHEVTRYAVGSHGRYRVHGRGGAGARCCGLLRAPARHDAADGARRWDGHGPGAARAPWAVAVACKATAVSTCHLPGAFFSSGCFGPPPPTPAAGRQPSGLVLVTLWGSGRWRTSWA